MRRSSRSRTSQAARPPSSVGQSLSLSINYKASAVAINTASLVIASNDASKPSYSVALRGLGTSGTGGTNEPSLQKILDLYQIPINVGDSNPNDVYLDNPPVAGNDEVTVQRLVKAGSGNVTIEPLAVFGVGSSTYTTLELGYYKPGSKDDKTKLFSVSGTTSTQSVDPAVNGVTTFDPGNGAFGLYGLWPSMQTISPSTFPQGTETYSEDSLNVAMDANSPRKFRFYKLKDSDGAIVQNAYVVAVEEFNAGYDNQDVVFIIRNVAPSNVTGPEIGLQNMDGLQYSDRLIFSKTSSLNTTFPNTFHDQATVRINNTGASALTVSGLTISGTWSLVGAPSTPFSIAAGGYKDITLKFTATSGTLQQGQLTIASNDADEPLTNVTLVGWRQAQSENPEPSLQQTFDIFGYSTVVQRGTEQLVNGGKVEAHRRRSAFSLLEARQRRLGHHRHAARRISHAGRSRDHPLPEQGLGQQRQRHRPLHARKPRRPDLHAEDRRLVEPRSRDVCVDRHVHVPRRWLQGSHAEPAPQGMGRPDLQHAGAAGWRIWSPPAHVCGEGQER